MKKDKQFDCVKMKRDIQQKIAHDYAGMSEDEARRVQMERVARNATLGQFIKKVRPRNRADTRRI